MKNQWLIFERITQKVDMKKIHTENQERKKAGYKNEKSIYAFSNGIYNGGVGRLWK